MPPPWLVILALLCGVIGLLIGSRKGHAAWGFFLGLILSVLGIVIIALTKPTAEYQTRQAEARLRAEREARRRLDAERVQEHRP